ncbi:unnamed protein product, partial [Rotaria sp. Silwood2]
SLASALTLSWSVIFSHTFKTKSPKCWSNRFLGNVWGGFGIVFIAIYTAKLAAFMVDTGQTDTASNIQGIVDVCRNMPRCTVGVVANTSDEEYLRRFYRNTLYRNIQYVSSYGDGIDLLRSHIITYLIMDHSMARYYLTRDVFKLIRISDDNFGTFGLSLGFSKFDTDLKDNMTNILLSYVDKGGMVLGFIILILEWLMFKYAVPYWRKRQWPGWMFLSQRVYAVLNASNDVYYKAYPSQQNDP